MKDKLWCKKNFDDRGPLTFDVRGPSMEDNLWWMANLMEDEIQLKTIFNGIPPLMEDDLWWQMTFDPSFDRRQPLMEDYLLWETSSIKTTLNWW